ncbi:MAG: hypothetical protein ACRELB_06370 [Polyangiaceae bacterium]
MTTVNSGLTMRIVPRALYDFTGLQASGKSTITIAQHIDASVFQEADLMVRFHTGTVIQGAAATLTVGLVTDGYDFSDPAPTTSSGGASAFAGPNPAMGSPGTVQATNATAFPSYLLSSWNQGQTTTPFGRLLLILLIAQQGGTSGQTLTALMSIDLVLKGGDPRAMPMMPNGYRGYRVM